MILLFQLSGCQTIGQLGQGGLFGAEEEIELPEELIVGHTTITKGDFFTEMFGNDTADIDVRALIHGYNLVNWDQGQGIYVIDPDVVQDVLVVADDEGNKTYFLGLAEDLYYSDGSHITAWDYAFSLLLMMAPEIEMIGGKIYRAEHILGYDDYINGDVPFLTGVNVISDYQLAITLDHEFLPYFFEIGLLLCVPYPISVIAPGCKVYDDGYGVYIGNEDPTIEEPIFTADLLRETILDPETGYNTHPSVVSGPYKMIEWDGGTGRFEINPFYKRKPIVIRNPDEEEEEEGEEGEEGEEEEGEPEFDDSELEFDDDEAVFDDEDGTLDEEAPEGETLASTGDGEEAADGEEHEGEEGEEDVTLVPSGPEPEFIKKITFRLADNDTLVEEFKNGQIHLVNKMVYGPVIQELMQSGMQMQNYPRIGLSFFTFSYDWPTVHEMEVRQAIAWCMDREALTRDYCRGFGQVVNAYYGIEQWEWLLINGAIDFPVEYAAEGAEPRDEKSIFPNMYATSDSEYDAMIEAWDQLNLDNLTVYGVDEDQANHLLDEAGWTLNREGQEYDPEQDDVRCKEIDGELVALDLSMLYPEGNHIIDTIQENFIDHLNNVGILLTLVPAKMEDLLATYYREAERKTDMIYLATNYHVIVDPSITYSADDEAVHLMWNNTFSDDKELYDLSVDMRKTEPGDVYTYVTKWIKFQERYNEVLPCIPLYSNIYFDFFTPYLQNYYITAHVTWSQAILESFFGLPIAEEEEEEEEKEGFEEDGESFEGEEFEDEESFEDGEEDDFEDDGEVFDDSGSDESFEDGEEFEDDGEFEDGDAFEDEDFEDMDSEDADSEDEAASEDSGNESETRKRNSVITVKIGTGNNGTSETAGSEGTIPTSESLGTSEDAQVEEESTEE